MDTANYNISLVGAWEFHLGELPVKKRLEPGDCHIIAEAGGALHKYDVERASWAQVLVPHDWLSYLPYGKRACAMNGYKQRAVGWYRKSFKLDGGKIESARIIFEGILGESTVFVNGVIAKRNFSGYNKFSAEIGDYLIPNSDNEIYARVDGGRAEGWFYEGAGIYRPAVIELRQSLHFDKDACFIRTERTADAHYLRADIACANPVADAAVEITLTDDCGAELARLERPAAENTEFCIKVDSPLAWSPENPYLYHLICKLKYEKRVIDSYDIDVGFRDIELIRDSGFYLNGERYAIKGICSHQDHAGVGAALTDELIEYRIRKLKSLGVNAYRTAHNAPSEELLRVCDRVGMLVMVENRTFSLSDDALAELRSLVTLSRNHPSVVFYSLFNEEPWQNDERGYRIAKRMRDVIHSLDGTRFVTAAQNSGLLEKINAADSLDIIGANYNLKNYSACHERQPEKLILGTENCPTFATRGVYKTNKAKRVFSSYGDEYADWFSESIDETMAAVRKYPYVIGCFVWCGFEHKGEPVPYSWPSVYSHWGTCDSCGFEKDTAYLLRAYYSDKLNVHLLPNRKLKSGEKVTVTAFTNGESAELFSGSRSLGERKVENCRASWKIPYEDGELTVKACGRGGEAFASIPSFDNPERIVIEDATPTRAKPTSRILNLKIVDKMGALVVNFNKNIRFSLDGGRILGVGNGDPNSHHDEKASCIRAFFGRAQIIISSDAKTITASCGKMISRMDFYEKR